MRLTADQAKQLKKGDKLTVYQDAGGVPSMNIPGGWQTGYFQRLARDAGSQVVVCQLPIPPEYPELYFYLNKVKAPRTEDAFEDWGVLNEL